ncbi:hypothetical protein COCHEDRAFT_1211333 [Bipolaris maydis C5]|uniref:Uncharacterized protein n=1 Tax=Cochliobolus heterostrophus (strain C5 / ATCC 48332 / race O) TaxID=701091 RepID=M2U9Y1_COCH5|nr:hypothetical protein COCHEDRAFT_1211333 [Bipolaris maydis C5]
MSHEDIPLVYSIGIEPLWLDVFNLSFEYKYNTESYSTCTLRPILHPAALSAKTNQQEA